MNLSAQPWDRQRGEPQIAYVRFLIYRNQGPGRTLDAAYQVYRAGADDVAKGAERCPGFWQRESVKYRWVDRSAAWDIHNLTQQAEVTIIRFIAAMNKVATKVHDRLETLEPESWDEIISTVKILAAFIPNETIEKLARSRRANVAPGRRAFRGRSTRNGS